MLASIVAASKSRLLRTLALILYGCMAPVRLFTTNNPLLDADIWWHWRVGQWILTSHHFPHQGLFSQYGETHPWRAYSWGFEVMLAKVFAHFGLLGFPIFFMVVEVILALVLFRILRDLSGTFWGALLLAAATLMAIGPNLVGRPVMFSILLFTVELGILFQACQTGRWQLLYWLPPLFLLWANLHIQFVYGLFPLGLFVVLETMDSWVQRFHLPGWLRRLRPASLTSLWIVLGLSLVATLANPYMAGLYRVVWIYAGTKTAFTYISEMHANSFRQSAHYVELLLAVGAFFFLGRCRAADRFKLLLLVSGSLIAFRSARDAWFIAIPAALVIADSWRTRRQECPEHEGMAERKTGGQKSEVPAEHIGALQLTVILLGVAGILTLHGLDSGFSRAAAMKAIENVYPMRAVRFVRQRNPPGPLYNSFNEGGFLIGNLPEYPVSIDGRADLYPDEFLAHYMSVAGAGPDWQQDPTLERANLVILEPYLPLARELEHDSRFQVVYSDEQATVFIRNKQQAISNKQ
jgi:hypothetical protein